jgi:hypothetical protein
MNKLSNSHKFFELIVKFFGLFGMENKKSPHFIYERVPVRNQKFPFKP